MKIGIIISDNDAEKYWNAFRFGNFCLGEKHLVNIFLMEKGVEYQKTSNEKFNSINEAETFLSQGGENTSMRNMHKIKKTKRFRDVPAFNNEGRL